MLFFLKRCAIKFNANYMLQSANAKSVPNKILHGRSVAVFWLSIVQKMTTKTWKSTRQLTRLTDLMPFDLRYHGRWIDSVWKSRSYAGALKENPINLYIFWKLNSYRIQSYVWNLLKSYCHSDIKRNTQKHSCALTGSLPRVNHRSGPVNIGNVFSHITLKKGVGDFPDVVWFFFSTPS